jgi:hypothetical protein
MSIIFTNDLDVLKAFGHRAEEFDKITGAYVVQASIKIASDEGYLLGSLVFDAQNANWALDTTGYGDEV